MILQTLVLCLSYLFAAPEVIWDFDVKEDELGNPRTTIYLLVDGKKHAVGKGTGHFHVLQKEVFSDLNFQVPKNALTACAGFWAGLSHHFCVIQKGKVLEVKEGFLDEGATKRTKIKYKTIQTIPL